MKILMTGANGMLAKAVRKQFEAEELICTDIVEDEIVKKLDITDLEQVQSFVAEHKPDVIINCAAYTAVDKAEEELKLARKINYEGPKNLAITANQNGCVLVHISTDYVFGGNLPLDHVYQEDDEKAPVTVYGITKLEGEKAIEQNAEKYYIFRTAWLYGEGKNFVRTMLKLSQERDTLTVVCDQHGSPTYAVDLANIIYQALEKKIPYGIYHTTNLGYTTWFEFAKEIFAMAHVSCKVKPVTSEQYKTPAKRPFNSMLSKDKILQQGITIPDWKDALKRYLEVEVSHS